MIYKLLIALSTAACACSPQRTDPHWPPALAPGQAALFSHNEVEVNASCARVWSVLIDAPHWPDWYSNARDVTIAGGTSQLALGSHFNWRTFGVAVQSEVLEFEPFSRLSWQGRTQGMTAYHTWRLDSLPGRCHVVTQETNDGPAALALRRDKPDAIHEGHVLWLAQLKAATEQ